MKATFIQGLAGIRDKYEAFVFDQFGVLHDGTSLYPNVVDVLRDLRSSGKTALVLTNSGKTEAQNLARIYDLGVPQGLFDGAVTSGDVARFSALPKFVQRFGRRMFHIAGPGEDVAALRSAAKSIRLVDRPREADFVYLSGMPDREDIHWYRDLIGELVERSLPLLCSNPDYVSPRPGGLAVAPGRLAAEYAERGGDVELVGKPHPAIYEACVERIGLSSPGSILFIGDSYHHDVVGAASNGFDSLMLLGGVHRECFAGKQSETEVLATLASSLVENGIEPSWLAREL